MFLHTFLKFFVSGSWQLFNMRNRFYIPMIRFTDYTYFFFEVLFARFIFSDFLLIRFKYSAYFLQWFLYQVFLAGNPIPVTGSYWWKLYYLTNGLTVSFLFISSWFMEHLYLLWIEWFSFVFLLFSFDEYIIALRFLFVNTFLWFFSIFFHIIS